MAFPEEKHYLFDFLIDSLNDSGFLEQDLEELASEISFKKASWIEATGLKRILGGHQGTRTYRRRLPDPHVQEYLLHQLKNTSSKGPDTKVAIRILEEYFQDLRSCNLEKLKRELGLEDDEIKIVLTLLSHLKTRPVNPSAAIYQTNSSVLPDFIVMEREDELDVVLYRQRSSSLYISQSWVEMVQHASQNGSMDKAALQYLRNKLSSAQWFVNAVQQRESNMMNIMKSIVDWQYEYFKFGDILLLRPMKLKNIADKVGVDISTVSRLTCNKYAETGFGTILLKDLFTEGIVNKEGNSISNRVIQTIIEEVVGTEDKKRPYTDRQLVSLLATRGTILPAEQWPNAGADIPVAQIGDYGNKTMGIIKKREVT